MQHTKQLYRICCQLNERRVVLNKLLQSQLGTYLASMPVYKTQPNLLLVLLFEALYSQYGLRCSKQLATPIRQRIKELIEAKETAENETETSSSTSSISNICVPRYARVNTLKTTIESVHDTLKHQGWLVQHWTKQPVKWKRFRKLISAMQPNWYYADCHIDDLLVFPVGTDLHKNKLVRDGSLILQDKASCLPIICLQPRSGSDVVDTCAAPGIKSFHLASMLDDSGNIYSFDREKRRIHTMQQLLRNVGASCVHVHNEDFLRVDVRKDKRLAMVEYALVDPPCSGSGIVSRQNSGAGDHTEQQQSRCADPKRLKSLANFQAMLLKHTFNIRRLQRLVYSTCSTSAEENEMVIQEILSDSSITNNFQLITAPVPQWTLRGLPEYDFSEKVLRADPQKTLTNGFFVAVFERI